ncbi:hypothetical protein [Microbacterium sp. 1.5R]|uniref:hypothetical protein n=1 Tax=Microbacterium sp. 1.5R TaxID=1916917 RepID=UPI0011AB1028|nr:hypothetical protein [Microbacterium sp. 1.5R]
MSHSPTLSVVAAKPSGDRAGRVFVIACSIGIAAGVVAITGMLLAAGAFANASTIVIPLIASFEGFLDADGVNAVTITGSWAMAGAVTVVLALALSFFILRLLRIRPTATSTPE